MRRQDKGLSATWVEYFAGDRSEQLVGAVPAIRASAVTVGKNSGFAVGKVGMVAKACADRNHKIRIVLSPDSDNTAHAEFRQMPRDDLELL